MLKKLAVSLSVLLVALGTFGFAAVSLASASGWNVIEAGAPSDANSTSAFSVQGVSCPSAGDCSAIGWYDGPQGEPDVLLLDESSGSWHPTEASLPSNASSEDDAAGVGGGIDCTSAGNCVAVYAYNATGGSTDGAIFTETSGMWATGVEAPLPSNANTSQNVALNSVACPSAGNCTAVGYYTDSSGYEQGLLLSESSGTWSASEADPPSGAQSGGLGTWLSNVTCTSAGNCAASGGYALPSYTSQPMVVTESSGTWQQGVEIGIDNAHYTLENTPIACTSAGNCVVTGSNAGDNTTGVFIVTETSGTWGSTSYASLPSNAASGEVAEVSSLSCPAAGDCVEVGGYDVTGTYELAGLILSESSGTWSATEATPPSGATDVELSAVSCLSVGNCDAIGGGYAESETSGTWQQGVGIAAPSNEQNIVGTGTNAISCTSADNCVAVGDYNTTAEDGFVASESSGSWSQEVEPAIPSNAALVRADAFDQLACTSATDCIAVGHYFNSSGETIPVVEEEVDGTWGSSFGVAAPANAYNGSAWGGYTGLSCPSAGNCEAVGTYSDDNYNTQGLILSESSGTWSTTEAQLPYNAGTLDTDNPRVTFTAISCADPGDCEAVGMYTTADGVQEGLLMSEIDGTWQQGVEAPLPSGANSTGAYPSLNDVSCPSAGNCVAVGQYLDDNGNTQGLILTETSGSWGASESPEPSSNNQSETNTNLNGVDCPASTNDCTAVGQYLNASSLYQPLMVDESSGSWSALGEALPSDALTTTGQPAQFSGVSCSSAGNCAGEGYYINDSSYSRSLFTAVESSGTWGSAEEVTMPSNAGTVYPNPALFSISCADARNCAAVGQYTDASGNIQALAVSEASGTWSAGTEITLPSNADPYGYQDATLNSVSCPARGMCTAVGSYAVNGVDTEGLLISDVPVSVTPPVTAAQRRGGGGGADGGVVKAECDPCAGDPIDVASGDFFESATDASVPTFGPSLSFTRTYDASSAQQEEATATPGPLGYGWTDNWTTQLLLNTMYSAAATGYITFEQANGSEVLFVAPQSGECPSGYVGSGATGTFCTLPRVFASLTYQSSDSTYTLTTSTQMTYTFNSSGQLVSIADPNGATETVTYDSPSPGSGNCPSAAASCETVTAASGRTLTITWSQAGDSGFVTSVTDPMGRTTTYSYLAGNLVSVTDPLGNVTSYGYDTDNSNATLQSDLLTVTSPNAQPGGPDAGDVTTNTYNASGQVVSQTDPMGRVTSYDYSDTDPTTLTGTVTVTDPDGNQTDDEFSDGVLAQQTTGVGTPNQATTTYDVDPSTLLPISVTDPNGNTTSYTYDANGNLTSKTNALGETWTYAYNPFGEHTCETQPEASETCSSLTPPSAVSPGGAISPPSSAPPPYVTYSEYDTNGNPIWTTEGVYQPGSDTSSYSRTTYELYNNESVTISGNDDSCAASAPSAELPCATIDANGVVTQLGYNSAGDLTSSSTPDGNSGGELATTTHTYDQDGELTSTTSPDGNVSGSNAANYTTTFSYNVDGEETSVTTAGGSGATVVPRTTTYTYDANGNRTSTSSNASSGIDLVGTASGNDSGMSLTLSYPQAAQPGDEVILATTMSPLSGSDSATTPSGYSLVRSQTTGSTTTEVFSHTIASGETSVTLTYSTSDPKSAVLAVYSGVSTDTPIDATSAASAARGTSVTAPSVTTSNEGDELVLTGGVGQSSSNEHLAPQGGLSTVATATASIPLGNQDISTVAGTIHGDAGDGGPATSAPLNNPAAVAVNAAGDLYIADTYDCVIREVNTSGTISTVAGNGTCGYSGDGGPATSAELNDPGGIVVNAAGDLYIADTYNSVIREVSTSGTISTVAGEAGNFGYSGDGGPATSAELYSPEGVAVDSAGDLFIADTDNDVIREVNTAGTISTVAGNGNWGYSGDGGPATSAELADPWAVAVDSDGDLFIADAGNNVVREVNTSGTISTVAGNGNWGYSGDGGPATSAELDWPEGIALDSSGDLLIADNGNSVIREVNTSGTISTVAGNGNWGYSGDGGPATSAELDGPEGIALDSSGDLFIADQGNDVIREVNTSGAISTVAGNGTVGLFGDGGPPTSATLADPFSVAVDSAGDIYISDTGDCVIREVNTSGTISTVAGNGTCGYSGDGGPATSAELAEPAGLAIDAAGDLFIADSGNDVIREVNTSGTISTVAGNGNWGYSGDGGSATSAELDWPRDIAVNASGDLFIADAGNNVIREVNTSGTISTVAGNGNFGYSGDGGPATSAELAEPQGIAVDSAGDLFISDTYNNRIRKVNISGTISTIAGDGEGGFSGDGGLATSASVPQPQGIAVDSSGDLFIADYDASVVSEVNTSGTISTVAGEGDSVGYSGDGGPATSAELRNPEGVALDSAGDLFIADTDNDVIREVTNVASASYSGTSISDGASPGPAGPTGSVTASVTTPGELNGVLVALSPGTGSTSTTATTYDADNEPVLVTDPDGNTTLTCYDGDGNVAEVVPPIGVAENGLTEVSCATSALYPDGYENASGVEYQPTSLATDATLDTYDAQGNKLTETTPAPAGQSSPKTTTYAYDPGGLLESVTSPPASDDSGAADSVTTYDYDAANELTAVTDASGTSTASTTSYCYDPDGDETASVPGDGNTSGITSCSTSSPWQTSSAYQSGYSYDSLGELVSKTTPATSAAPDGASTSDTYDADGNLLTSTAPSGVTTTNTYTPLGEVATTAYSDGTPSDSYTYDADGSLVSMTDGSGTSSYVYDPFGELTSTTNGAGQTVSYTYDSLGDETSITYPLGSGATWAQSDTVTFGYDAASNLTSVTDFNGNTIGIINNADGLPTQVTLGESGDVIDTNYDATDTPSSIDLDQGSSTLLGFSYSDSPSGAIASETDSPSGGESYSYDANSRVTQTSSNSFNYDYDAASNLTTLPTGAMGSYDDASELTSSTLSGTTTDYSYNADGERTGATQGTTSVMSATYDGAGDLTSYDNAVADLSSATYDGIGLRTSDTVTPSGGSPSAEGFVWDTTPSVPQLLMDGTNAYVYAGGSAPIEQVNLSSGTISYLISDALGSVRGVVDSLGNLSASTSYDAWGNPETSGGLTSYTPFGFAGGYTDATGLIYLINRYYDPQTGQFISVDPLVGETGEPYAYTSDDPVNASDPSGLVQDRSCLTCVTWYGGPYPVWQRALVLTNLRTPTIESAYSEYVTVATAGSDSYSEYIASYQALQNDVNDLFETVLTAILNAEEQANEGTACYNVEQVTDNAFDQAAQNAGISITQLEEGTLSYVAQHISLIVDDPYLTGGLSISLIENFVQTPWAKEIFVDQAVDLAGDFAEGFRFAAGELGVDLPLEDDG